MKNRLKKAAAGVSVLATLIAVSATALAQCPMCKAAIEGSADARAAVNGLNLAVVVLLVPPVAIFSGVFFFVLKHRNAPN